MHTARRGTMTHRWEPKENDEMNEQRGKTNEASQEFEDKRHPDQRKPNADIELLRKIGVSNLPAEFHSTGLLKNLNASMESYSTGNGKLKMRYESPEDMHNGAGVVHGGIITTILDQTMINALFLADEELVGSATTNMAVTYVRPLISNVAIVTAWPVFVGNRVAQLSAECFDDNEDGPLAVTATESALLHRKVSR